MPTHIQPGLPQGAHGSADTATSTPQPPQTQAGGSLPAGPHGGARNAVKYRSEEIAKLDLELGPNQRTPRPLRKDRPTLPAPLANSPGAGSFDGMPVALQEATQAQFLQSVAAQSLALLELWEHQMKELPLHLETHEAHSAPNERALRSYFSDLDEVHADFVERFQMKMSERLIGLGYGREEITLMVAQMLDQARPPNKESSSSKQNSAALKDLCDQLRCNIDEHLQDVKQNGTELKKDFLKDQYRQLLAARRDYRCALGYSTAVSMRSERGGGASPGPALHGASRAHELLQSHAESRSRADALRNEWKSIVVEEAAARRSGAQAGRADRPKIPAILSVEHELSTNTGRFSGPRTPEELGIADIIAHFFPQAPGTNPAFDPQARLIPRAQVFNLRSAGDVAWLASELATSSAPFHVLCIPGTSDGSFERSLVFRNAGTPDFPKWQLLPRTGNPVDKDVTSLGLARNPGQEAQVNDGAGIPRPGTPFPSADEKRGQPLPNRYGADTEHNQKLMRMESNAGGKIAKPARKDILLKILEEHVEVVRSAGGNHAPVIIMSPVTTKAKTHHALARHLGYDLDFRVADSVSLSATLRKTGCELDEELLVDDESEMLKDGFFDMAPCGTALHIVLTDKSTCTLVWNKEQRNQAMVQVDNDMGAFASLGLQNNQAVDMTPSAAWKQIEGKLPGSRASKFMIESSGEGKVAALLTGEAEEKSQLELMQAARKEGIPIGKLNSFQVFSYLFMKQHPKAMAATYRLNDAEDGGNVGKLGELLDNTHESFMVEFEELNDDDEFEKQRFFFQAPGQSEDKDEIVGEACSSGKSSFNGPPSLLLQNLADEAEDGTSTAIISILSTGPLAENDIDIDGAPEHVRDALAGMMRAGLPVIASGETDQLGFIECLHDRCGGIPSEITGKMIADFAHPDTGRLTEDGHVETSFRLSAVPPLNVGPDFKGTLIRVPTDAGPRNITFHEDDAGNTFFIDLHGKKQPAGALEPCALSQGWHARAPVEILQFSGDLVQPYDLLGDEEMKIDSSDNPDALSSENQATTTPAGARHANPGSQASTGQTADLGEDTDWEDSWT